MGMLIKVVLRDNWTYDVLILGTMLGEGVVSGNKIRGEICGIEYILTDETYGRMNISELAKTLGINPNRIVSDSFSHIVPWGFVPSVLPYVNAVQGNTFREALEKEIRRYLRD